MIAKLNVSAAGWMVECDSCNVWYHGKCVNAKKSTIETTEQFLCPSCAHKTGIPYLFDRTPVCSLLPQNIRKASPKFCIHCCSSAGANCSTTQAIASVRVAARRRGAEGFARLKPNGCCIRQLVAICINRHFCR